MTTDRILPRPDEELQRPTKYTILQDGVLSRATEYLLHLRKYAYGRQSACYDCGNTPTADSIHDAIGWSTLMADRVLATTAETFRRPKKYFLNLRKHRDGHQSTLYHLASELSFVTQYFPFGRIYLEAIN